MASLDRRMIWQHLAYGPTEATILSLVLKGPFPRSLLQATFTPTQVAA